MQQVRHTTASTFFFARFGTLWRMCVVEHPRHGGYLAPGGHVREERDEPPADAALREAVEESGFHPRLLPAPLPSGYPHPGVVGPWWTVDMTAGPDGRAGVRHLHRDHVFVGVVALPYEPVGTPELPVRWVGREELQALDAPADTKVLGATSSPRPCVCGPPLRRTAT
ncbi:NUDIX domain-containing protein [Streptomyces californicus]|uniref:NUDIX domain-containing protein n=1 Tax=Streptomyces californicus TaxID=67351 RepID=UPI0037AE0E63